MTNASSTNGDGHHLGAAWVRIAKPAVPCPHCETVGRYLRYRRYGTVGTYGNTSERQASVTFLSLAGDGAGVADISRRPVTSGNLAKNIPPSTTLA